MKYLIIATKYGDKNNKWLTNELAEYIKQQGNDVSVLALSWMESEPKTSISVEDGIKVYRYKLPGVFYLNNTAIKYIKQVVFPIMAYLRFKKELLSDGCERLITFTPAHLVDFVTRKIKIKSNAKCFLVLWDFFPFYLNHLNSNGRFFKFLKWFENGSFNIFDSIGVMTEKNRDFLLSKYEKMHSCKVVKLPIWAEVNSVVYDDDIRVKYGLSKEDFIFIYGGAHSVVQGLDNLIELAKRYIKHDDVKFVFVGKGADRERLKDKAKNENVSNVIFLEFIPRKDYEKLIKVSDVGLVSLSEKMSVPSFPSKSLDYMKCSVPILASIDRVTDYGNILHDEMKCGHFSYADDMESLYNESLILYRNDDYRKKLGENGRLYFEQVFDVGNIFSIIDKEMK